MKIIVHSVKVDGDRDQYAMTSNVENAVRKAIVSALSSIDGISVTAYDTPYYAVPTDEHDYYVEFLNDEWELTRD